MVVKILNLSEKNKNRTDQGVVSWQDLHGELARGCSRHEKEARAPSVWKTIWRPSRNFFVSGFKSFFRMGPGPGDHAFVADGFKRMRQRELGHPLCAIPHHCSHCVSSFKFSRLSKTPLPKSTSSALPRRPPNPCPRHAR